MEYQAYGSLFKSLGQKNRRDLHRTRMTTRVYCNHADNSWEMEKDEMFTFVPLNWADGASGSLSNQGYRLVQRGNPNPSRGERSQQEKSKRCWRDGIMHIASRLGVNKRRWAVALATCRIKRDVAV